MENKKLSTESQEFQEFLSESKKLMEGIEKEGKFVAALSVDLNYVKNLMKHTRSIMSNNFMDPNFKKDALAEHEEKYSSYQKKVIELIEEAKTTEFSSLNKEDVIKELVEISQMLESMLNEMENNKNAENQEEEVKMSFTQRVINFFRNILGTVWKWVKAPFVWVKSLFSKSEDNLDE